MKLQFEDNEYYLMKDGDEIAIATTDESFITELGALRLSRKNCEAVVNGYDLDELVESSLPKSYGDITYDEALILGFRTGFQKALSILGDKKFSEEQLRELGILMIPYDTDFVNDESRNSMKEFVEAYIQSLQQTEFDVNVITERHQVKIYIEPHKVEQYKRKLVELQHPWTTNPDNIWEYAPKLDENNCLILKRK